MTLYNHRGEEIIIDKKAIKEVVATASTKGVRSVKTKSVASGLNPTKCAKIIKAANEGSIFDYLTIAEQAEEMSGHYYSVLQTRKLAIRGIEPVVKAASDDKKDVEIAEEVRRFVGGAAFTDLVFNLLDAISKGYSICEIIYDTGDGRWTPSRFVWQDPRNFTFDKETRTRPLLLQDDDEPEELAYGKFIYHTPKLKSGITIRGGLTRVILWPLMFSQFSERDWMAFTEVFGMPVRLGKYSGSPSDEEINTLWKAVQGIASDSAAVIHESMDIEFVTASNSAKGDAIFAKAAEHFEASISKAVLGQTMTTDDGSSNAQAQVHNDVRMDILEADAMALASTIQRDLIDTFVLLNYGADIVPPKFSLPVPKPEDVKALVDGLVKLVPLGLKVAINDIYPKLGIAKPKEDAELLGVGGVVKEPEEAEKKLNRIAKNNIVKNAAENTDDIEEIEGNFFDDFVETSIFTAEDILKVVGSAKNYEDCMAKLNAMTFDEAGQKMVESLANSNFMARAVGDVKDG